MSLMARPVGGSNLREQGSPRHLLKGVQKVSLGPLVCRQFLEKSFLLRLVIPDSLPSQTCAAPFTSFIPNQYILIPFLIQLCLLIWCKFPFLIYSISLCQPHWLPPLNSFSSFFRPPDFPSHHLYTFSSPSLASLFFPKLSIPYSHSKGAVSKFGDVKIAQ